MSTWHAPAESLARYATRPEDLDEATASSIELHLLGCAACRDVVAERADPAPLRFAWQGVVDRIDSPRRTVVERFLAGLRVPEAHARLVAATPALQATWLLTMAAVVAAVVALAVARADPGPFLVVAPVVPLVSVAVAFAAGSDPAGEAGAAAPLTGAGLALRRTVAVLAASLSVLAAGAVALPGLALADAAWVLPALGLSVATLALATWARVEAAAAGLGGLWLASIWLASRLATGTPAADLAPLARPGQLCALAVIAVAAGVLAARRDRLAGLARLATAREIS